jgi:Ca2+-binding RTX toxin-like protein
VIDGGTGDDKLDGGAGNNTISYSTRSSVLVLTLKAGQAIHASIDGVQEDTLRNFENVVGAGLADRITGDEKNNSIDGYYGDDILKGMNGNDTLIGNAGHDTMSGGAGRDIFVFRSTFDFLPSYIPGTDVITDFAHNADRLDFSEFDANGADKGAPAFHLIATEGARFTGKGGELGFDIQGGKTIVEGDIDGDRKADFQIVLNGAVHLDKGDFIL